MAESESENYVAVSARLKALREEQGLSIEAVAEKLNLSVEQIAKLEQLNSTFDELTPFERGYIRNYAGLVGLDLKEFEEQFPDGIGVGSDLFSVQRYSYKVSKPIMSRGWVKKLFYLVIVIGLIVFLASLDIDLNELGTISESTEESQIVLPQIEEQPITNEIPEQQ